MKRVSFETAKALKDVGYPQYGHCEDYYTSEGLPVSKFCDMDKLVFPAPTYIETWLWLWREKGICIKDTCDGAVWVWSDKTKSPIYIVVQTKDPEESIIASIEYLVTNKLLK